MNKAVFLLLLYTSTALCCFTDVTKSKRESGFGQLLQRIRGRMAELWKRVGDFFTPDLSFLSIDVNVNSIDDSSVIINGKPVNLSSYNLSPWVSITRNNYSSTQNKSKAFTINNFGVLDLQATNNFEAISIRNINGTSWVSNSSFLDNNENKSIYAANNLGQENHNNYGKLSLEFRNNFGPIIINNFKRGRIILDCTNNYNSIHAVNTRESTRVFYFFSKAPVDIEISVHNNYGDIRTFNNTGQIRIEAQNNFNTISND